LGLSPAGEARAKAYVAYFQNYKLRPLETGAPLKLDYLFAAADSPESDRPSLTVAPLAAALSLPVDAKIEDKNFGKLETHLRSDGKYVNSHILICWHHERILDLAGVLLGVDPDTLPTSSNWPKHWPGDVYGWLLQIVYDCNGQIVPDQTLCINEALMPDDTQNPPGDGSSGGSPA
jgi:hypothetical protein